MGSACVAPPQEVPETIGIGSVWKQEVLDKSEDDSAFLCGRLVQLSQQGDASLLQEEVLKMQDKHGRESVARDMAASEFGGRGSKSALHTAAVLGGRAEVLRILLEAGVNPNALDDSSSTPLHHAAARGNARVAYLLLQAGADQTIGNGFGSTPLVKAEESEWDVASIREGKEYIRRMFQQGFQAVSWGEMPADAPECKEPLAPSKEAIGGIWATAAPSDDDSTDRADGALGIWAKIGPQTSDDPSDVSTICTSRASDDPLRCAEAVDTSHLVRRPLLADLVRSSDIKGIEERLAEAFLQGGQQVAIAEVCDCEEDARDSRVVYSALHVAAFRSNASILRMLLGTNADPNLKTDAGDTPLHFAASRGDKETISVLLSAGADRRIMNNFGRAPNLPSLVR